MDLVPFVQSDSTPGVRKMKGEGDQFLHSLEERSLTIRDDAYVEEQWLEFCEEHKQDYLSTVLGHGRILRRLTRLVWVRKLLYGRRELLGVRNVVCCETHREALETIFDHSIILK